MKNLILSVLIITALNDLSFAQAFYYPPLAGNTTWERVEPKSLGWNTVIIPELEKFLIDNNSKSFVILHKGRIAIEKYYAGHDANKAWYWASAGKTLTSGLVGIASQKNLIDLNAPSSKYLGKGWTSCTPEDELKITVNHQLAMSTGLNDAVNADCTDSNCLKYKAPAGTRWAYHNGPYTILDKVIENGTGDPINVFFKKELADKIGMNGAYIKSGFNNVFWSNTLSMARYGLLLLSKGKWQNNQIISEEYLKKMSKSSQEINPSYGYLTWLNGYSKFMLPNSQFRFNGPLLLDAPSDAYFALGKNDQKIHVVPSMDLVIVRMGDASEGDSPVPTIFDNRLWIILNKIFKSISTSINNLEVNDIEINMMENNLEVVSKSAVSSLKAFDIQGRLLGVSTNKLLQLPLNYKGTILVQVTTIDRKVLVKKILFNF